MIRSAILLLLAPVAVEAQLQLLVLNGTQQTPVASASTFSLGQVAAGAAEAFIVRAVNGGTAPIRIVSSTPAISGTGFSITSPATPPPIIAPGSFLDIYINFAGGPPASYSANFQINASFVIFVIAAVPAGTLEAQLQLLVLNGTQQTPVASASTFSLGQVAAGASEAFIVRAVNGGTAPIPIVSDTPAISGTGFRITSPATPPPNIAPGSFLDIYINFAGGPPASYSANFQINASFVIFVITSVPAGTLTVASPCTGLGSTNAVNFGNIVESQTEPCTFLLQNLSSQQLTVSSITVTGTGFLLSQPPTTPLNLPAGVSANFTVTFAPQSAASYSGTLVIDSETYLLTGTAYNPPLPTPMLTFDTNTPESGQQVTLSMALPTPAQVAASGSVNLTFQPDASVSGIVSGDPTIVFVANGALSVPFSIQQGSTQATFGGQAGAVFQTGTTTGTITFTVSVTSGVQFTGDPTTSITLAPLPVQVENAAATAIAGALNIQVWGFDNTYSAGEMSFTFLDDTGTPIGAGPVQPDFGSAFLNYFATSTDGSAFAMLVSFPITGNAAEVGSVNVQMTNSAGTTTITQLGFLNDTGTCVLVGNTLTCPPAITQ